MCRDVSNNDTEELFAQRIFEIYTFVKFSNQILNHVTVFKKEVNSIKDLGKEVMEGCGKSYCLSFSSSLEFLHMEFIGHFLIWEDFQKVNILQRQHHQLVNIQ